MPVVAVVALAIYGGALLWGAASDLARFLIPNEVSLAIVAAFALFAFALPLTTIGWHLAAGAATLVVMALAFYRGLMGGGDAKLLSALALWTGFSNVLSLFFLTALVGGVEGMVFWLLRRILAGRVHPSAGTRGS